MRTVSGRVDGQCVMFHTRSASGSDNRVGRDRQHWPAGCAKASGFGLNVVAHDPFINASHVNIAGAGEVPLLSLDDLLATCDIVTLHCPLSPATHHLIGEAQLARMKPGALLINTARGGLIDQDALVASLKSGHLGGAGIDVTTPEPLPAPIRCGSFRMSS